MRAQQNFPDEDEQGGKFQQVEGLTTVDAEEVPCEFSVEDDFLFDEKAEGVDEETVKAIVAGKKQELDAMEAFGIFRCVRRIAEGCENYQDGKTFRKATSGDAGL